MLRTAHLRSTKPPFLESLLPSRRFAVAALALPGLRPDPKPAQLRSARFVAAASHFQHEQPARHDVPSEGCVVECARNVICGWNALGRTG